MTKDWEKIENGWYVHKNGAIIQQWHKAEGSPLDRAGWYVWLKEEDLDDECLGPFASMKKAIKTVQNFLLG